MEPGNPDAYDIRDIGKMMDFISGRVGYAEAVAGMARIQGPQRKPADFKSHASHAANRHTRVPYTMAMPRYSPDQVENATRINEFMRRAMTVHRS